VENLTTQLPEKQAGQQVDNKKSYSQNIERLIIDGPPVRFVAIVTFSWLELPTLDNWLL
jgi:hypothetical protein